MPNVPVRATKHVESVIYAKVNCTALSMSLAEGLVTRFLRETRHNQTLVRSTIQSFCRRTQGSPSAAQKVLGEMLANTGLLVNSFSLNKTHRILAVVTDGYSFQIRNFNIDDGHVRVGDSSYHISQHAVARYILRMRTVNWWQIFDELHMACRRAQTRSETLSPGDEFIIGTDNGSSFFKIDTNGEPVCVTWVDADKIRPDQADDTSVFDDMVMIAQKAGTPLMDYYHIPVKRSKECWSTTGSSLTFEEFRDDASSLEAYLDWSKAMGYHK